MDTFTLEVLANDKNPRNGNGEPLKGKDEEKGDDGRKER